VEALVIDWNMSIAFEHWKDEDDIQKERNEARCSSLQIDHVKI
jgi:hypothetical protein